MDFFVKKIEKEEDENLEALEVVTVLRLLDALGYGKPLESFAVSMEGEITDSDVLNTKTNMKKLIPLINESLQATHLVVNKKNFLI